jgi:hypothetical protein
MNSNQNNRILCALNLVKHTLIGALFLLSQSIQAQDIEQIKKADPIQLRGNLMMGFQSYKVFGIEPRSANPMWNINGSASMKVYGFDIPLSFTIGRQGNNVNYPTFRQFGASPHWRWLKVHAGWRNMNFSPYTLAGHSFLGAGVELNPGKFRFSAMQGRFRQARQGSDSYFPASYKRTGYGLKLGVGSANSYIDLIYFRAKDDPGSLIIKDSTLTPGENAVVGYATRFRLGRHIAFFSDAALSMYTRNVYSETVVDSTILPEVPLLLKPRFSTRLNYAARAGLDFHFRHLGLKMAYERIAPNFETMGAYYFNNDIQNITVSPNFGFAKNKARFFGTLGIQRNNLTGNRSETTNRVIGNAVLSINPTQKFGIETNYMNAAVNQRDGVVRLNDTIRVAMLNTNIGITPHWNWADSISSANLMFSANYQQLNDRNPFTREFANLNTAFVTANFSKNYAKTGWGWSAGANFNNIKVYQINSNRYGATLGINKTWNKGSNSAAWSSTWNLSEVQGSKDGSVWSNSLNIGWNFAEVYQWSIFTAVLINKSKAFENYTEWQGGTTLSRSFGGKDRKKKKI